MMTTTPDFRGNDRFSLVRRLGAGGMGVVFHAIDRERGAEVALKTLKFLDAAAIYHLKQEFRALADVRHPNLVRLHDLVSDAGHWFFTMDLVEGEDFLEHVRGKTAAAIPSPDTIDAPLPPDESTAERVDLGSLGRQRLSLSPLLDVGRLREALRQVAEGVAALHATHKLHRDLKPSNVMVRRDGRVVILDFGLAKDLHDGGSLQSIDQHVLGTPEYMSPEQGAARPLGPAADWYSVGVMLFEALTGGLPFVGSSLDILMAKEREDGPAPSRFVTGIPADLDRLCELLLRRRPQDRPPSDEILRRLGSIPITHDSSPRTSAAPPSLGGIVAPSSPFVGRTAARTSLDLAFRRSRQGRAVAAHLHGGAGVGKSALVRAFLEDAAVQHHALVLAGACFEREMVPFKAVDSVIDALSRHLRRLSRLQVEALLPREIHALSRLFPVLERVEAVAGAPALDYESPDRAEARRRAFAALRELLARIAGSTAAGHRHRGSAVGRHRQHRAARRSAAPALPAAVPAGRHLSRRVGQSDARRAQGPAPRGASPRGQRRGRGRRSARELDRAAAPALVRVRGPRSAPRPARRGRVASSPGPCSKAPTCRSSTYPRWSRARAATRCSSWSSWAGCASTRRRRCPARAPRSTRWCRAGSTAWAAPDDGSSRPRPSPVGRCGCRCWGAPRAPTPIATR
ncbi:MAG: serine/threonine-protein kinase PknK [Myxococcales bacterium]|nr:serine/threonine-protein kinase PknK [Myxococcales bacterium]